MAELNSADVRELLTAIREALTLPRAASYEHAGDRKQLLVDRTDMLRGMLTSIIGYPGELDLRGEAQSVRSVIAEHAPVTYPTRQDAQTKGIPARGTGECPDPECWGCTYCEGPADAEQAVEPAASSGETR